MNRNFIAQQKLNLSSFGRRFNPYWDHNQPQQRGFYLAQVTEWNHFLPYPTPITKPNQILGNNFVNLITYTAGYTSSLFVPIKALNGKSSS